MLDRVEGVVDICQPRLEPHRKCRVCVWQVRGRAGRIMARGATYPRAYRRVRACVFRRMPTQGGATIMAYPGGHPRANLDVCVWSVRAYPV